MSDSLFDPSVVVKDGKYLIREVLLVSDAIDLLEDWPAEKKDVVYQTVLNACREAQDGLRPVDVARKAFAQFARKNGIIADPKDIMPPMCANRSFRRRPVTA